MQCEVYKDAAGQHRWRLKAANYKIIANSGEGYSNKADCLAAFNWLRAVLRHQLWTPEDIASGLVRKFGHSFGRVLLLTSKALTSPERYNDLL